LRVRLIIMVRSYTHWAIDQAINVVVYIERTALGLRVRPVFATGQENPRAMGG
jgi:hypothetical protein